MVSNTPYVKRRYVRKGNAAMIKRVSARDVDVLLAKKVQKLERVVRARKPEMKFFDTGLAAANIVDTTGAVQIFNNPPQGTTVQSRVGDSIRVHRIVGHVRIGTGSASVGASPTGDEYMRMSVVQDKQQISDTAPTASDIYNSVLSPQSILLNLALHEGRFNVLATSPLIQLSRITPYVVPVAAANNQAPTQSPVWNFDFKCNILTKFNGANSSDIQKNGVYMVWRTNTPGDTLDTDGFVRIFYTDC